MNRLRILLVVIAGMIALTACDPADFGSIGQTSAVNITSGDLAGLTVKDRKAGAPKYSRSKFGRAWSDDADVELGHNGCTTRDDILARDLSAVRKSGRCKVVSGTLDNDPYSSESHIEYVRGRFVQIPGYGRHSPVEIDHVVSLSDAWKSGAYALDDRTRLAIANDPENLLAVYALGNQEKSDGDAAEWLPGRDKCGYVKRQIAVKKKYGLSVTSAEKNSMEEVLASCR